MQDDTRPQMETRAQEFQHLPADDGRAVFASDVISRLRARLLDLTARNPLLNYRHSDRAKAQVRVIDELPDVLHAYLAGGKSLTFRALREPVDDSEDEKSDEFQIALEAERLEDEAYIEGLKRVSGEDPNDPAVLLLERALRDRVRDKLGLPPRPPRAVVSLADLARAQGLDPNYELPTPESEDKEWHHDDEIQTLALPDRMDARLAALREGARRALEETGINTCFAAYGFVEWYESPESERPLHAPLLLQPLEIERISQRGRWRYFIKGSGDDTTINVTLAERMKQDFGLDWPVLAEDETPAQFFARITDVVREQRRWRVRRFVTFGLFAFGRLAMWHDLDPSRWPTDRQPATHPVAATLMAGGGGGEGTQAEEYNADAPEIVSRMPPLVLNADSSQLSVVVDALDGKSLAVKGPPGTGKSQTIANLIAAALAEGKTVLFVAEKMAALNVVKSRLDRAGLGQFIFELHSTKAKKKDVLESLARRIEAQSQFSSPARLEQELSELASLRSRLNGYVAVMNRPFGATGKTVQEILWAAQRRGGIDLPASVDRIVIPSVQSFTLADLERIRELLERFESVVSDLHDRWGGPARHPWAWVGRALSPFERDDVVQFVGECRDQVGRLRGLAQEWSGLVGTRIHSLDELRSLHRILCNLPGAPPTGSTRSILGGLADRDNREKIVSLERMLRTRQTLQERCAAFGPPEVILARTHRVTESADLVKRLTPGNWRVDQVDGFVNDLRGAHAELCRVNDAKDELVSMFDVGGNHNAATLEMTLNAARLVARTPRSALLHRRGGLGDPDARVLLESAKREADIVRDAGRQLRLGFDLARATDAGELRAAAQVLRSTGIFGRLGAAYRRARGVWRGLARQPTRVDAHTTAGDLNRIADYLDRERAFATNPDLVRMLGESFKGLETDLGPAVNAATFLAVTGELGGGRISTRAELRVQARVRDVLVEGHISVLDRIAAFARGEGPKLVEQGLGALAEHNADDISQVIAKLDGQMSAGSQLIAAVKDLQLNGECDLARVTDLATIVSEVAACEQALGELSSVRQAVLTAGLDLADPAGLGEAIRFVELLDAAEITEKIQGYVLNADVDERLAGLARFRERLGAELDRQESTAQTVGSLVGASGICASEVDLRALEERLSAGLDASDAIGEWSSYLGLRDEVVSAGAAAVVECYGGGRPAGLPQAYMRAFWRSLARAVFEGHEGLKGLTGSEIEAARQRFRDTDARILKLNGQLVASKVSLRKIPTGTDRGPRSEWTELALIRQQTQLQRPRIALRDLVRRAGRAVCALKPCWMMSPISAAQFIEPGVVEFDLVVIDEASQMRPEEAVGSIARGRQVVVVGDPMQLPPTRYFDRMDGFDDEEEEDLEEESILDLALGQFQPYRHLRWHYRSRHENLIRFSNKHFYDNKLIIFPSASDGQGALGVHYHPAGGGYKGRGGNPEEAKVVAEAAIEAMRRYPQWSLGVVAVNLEQAELLRMEVDRLVLRDADAQEYIAKWENTLEPFFVKNLENVQGDERDVIMISTVYGPNEQGQVMQRFGPINQATGHRRLNVLFTRAKCRVELHTSLTASQVRDGEGVSRGANALKAYLEYAAHGRLEGGIVSGREPESDFEVEVAEALRARGFEVVAQVGVEGFYIDLAVKHPAYPHGYLAGIECDGATYHSSKSAKDRDVLRQEVLEGLGWRLYRVWSTDWFGNRSRETGRLVRFLENLLEDRRPGVAVQVERPRQDTLPSMTRAQAAMPTVARRTVSAAADGSMPVRGSRNGKRLTECIVAELPDGALRCPRCAGRYEAMLGRYGPFLRCAGRCRGTGSIETETLSRVLERLAVRCPACGKPAVASRGPYGAFIGCAGYPKCPKGRRSWLDLRDELREGEERITGDRHDSGEARQV